MEDLILMARAAKKRMKGSFWADCKRNIDEHTVEALNSGLSEMRIKSSIAERVQSEVRGRREDEFYLRVKALLDAEGEVSDAIGRLTDREAYEKLSYEEKQRYTLELSAKYLAALNRYKKEKELKL
ncbi:MAG: hypothetical protein HFK03_02875 [Clostridia bacterium]|nr:hypothetical protein [Clostridia bacterium]